MPIDDYAGPFDPSIRLASFSRRALATLGREYMLFGHLLNRAGLPHVHHHLGPAAREAVAIEEWMGASPVYTRRMQAAMGFAGDDVVTIMKGLQIDVGFAHQYMDVQYEIEDPQHGYFWLPRCGALLEIEPHGAAAVQSMCHAIEDPTFDATAVATNPRARVRPIHRPPRVPADRVPHCRWAIVIDPAVAPVQEIPLTARVRASRLASTRFLELPAAEPGGWDDYAGPFDPAFHLERLSHRALVRVCHEVLLQNHLLVRALLLSVTARGGAEVAARVGTAQWVGAGAVAASRLCAALAVGGDDVTAIAKMLQLHPAFLPGHVRWHVAVDGPQRGRLWIEDGEAFRETEPASWWTLLGPERHPALDAMVQAVNPRAACVPVSPPSGARFAWEVRIEPTASPAAVPPEVGIVRASQAAHFVFRAHPLAA